jgi:CRP/FNR family cyclic AMP-dependent transcriptional regulator
MVPYSYGHAPAPGGVQESSPERVGPRRRGLARDSFLALVAVMLGGEALAPVRTRLTKPGDVLAEAGAPVRAVYAVLSGRLGIFQTGPGAAPGRPRLREVLGPGQRAGDAHVLADHRAPAEFSVQCLAAGLVAVIDADLYWEWCRRPEVALSVLSELAEQARARERLRASWLELDVTARMAALLLDLHERFGAGDLRVALGLSQSQLGDLIGARRETVNRANRALAAEGLVACGARGTELRDVKGLAVRAGRTPGGEPGERRAVS